MSELHNKRRLDSKVNINGRTLNITKTVYFDLKLIESELGGKHEVVSYKGAEFGLDYLKHLLEYIEVERPKWKSEYQRKQEKLYE